MGGVGVGWKLFTTKTDLNCSVEYRKSSQVRSIGRPELKAISTKVE